MDPQNTKESYEVKGSITWVDNNDKLGRRPYDIKLTLYQNGKEYSSGVYIVDSSKNSFDYAFTNLPKYDDSLNLYKYTVKQEFTSKVLTWNTTTKQMEEIDAYTSTTSDNLNFTNTLVDTKDKPIIEVKPEHINTLDLKLDFVSTVDWKSLNQSKEDIQATVILKQMETIVNNGNISYSTNYSEMTYSTLLTTGGVSLSNIPSGKYEIDVYDNTFELENIKLSNAANMSITKENGINYLIIDSTNINNSGTLTVTLDVKEHNGYTSSVEVNNLYKTE